MMRRSLVWVCLFVAGAAATARAQSPLPPDPAESSSRIRSGALTLTPRFELLNTGVDSNVFNESENPRKDFTATVRPSLDGTMRLSVVRLVFKASLDAVYFHEYEAERALNRSGEVRTELRLARLVPYVTVNGLSTNERPNNEIDVRAQRSLNTYTTGAALLVFSRTAAVVNFQRQRLQYDPAQEFAGEDLATQFNNRRTSYDAGARVALTELTTMTLTGGREEMRFDLSPERNSDSTRASLAFEFDPQAIITGTASVGFRDFQPSSAQLASYSGVVAQATIRYAYADRTVVSVRYVRDIDYSIEEAEPYYLLNAGSAIVTQRIGGPFDLQATLARENRDYRARAGAAPIDTGSSDTTDTAGGGVGYRLSETARIGLNIEFMRRDALNTGRPYDRRRIYTSVNYGF